MQFTNPSYTVTIQSKVWLAKYKSQKSTVSEEDSLKVAQYVYDNFGRGSHGDKDKENCGKGHHGKGHGIHRGKGDVMGHGKGHYRKDHGMGRGGEKGGN